LFLSQLLRFSCVASISDTTDSHSARKIQKIKKFATALAVLALAAIFTSLGLWQLDRARELSASLKAEPIQDQRIYNLADLTSPQGSLPVASFGKSVATSGHYIANYKAPNQIGADGKVADWEVVLLQVDTQSAILVLRGLWSERFTEPEIVMANQVELTGTIYPSQFEDRAANTSLQISRIDSSLLTSTSEFQLYDGFIAATSESTRAGEVTRSRIEISLPKGDVPGYYWQHISYVAIWWFMAGLILWAPFYKRRDEQAHAS
jgi:cytochrome oxidase assembly protein ShyY1